MDTCGCVHQRLLRMRYRCAPAARARVQFHSPSTQPHAQNEARLLREEVHRATLEPPPSTHWRQKTKTLTPTTRPRTQCSQIKARLLREEVHRVSLEPLTPSQSPHPKP